MSSHRQTQIQLQQNASRTANLSSSVASSSGSNRKENTLETVVSQLFSKTAQLVAQSRNAATQNATGENSTAPQKTNKWFNIETPEIDSLRTELKAWKASNPQPNKSLLIDVVLDISNLATNNQLLVLKDEVSMRRKRIPQDEVAGKNTILLESWLVTMLQPAPSQPPETAVMYKKCVMFFRSLFTHLRLLPAYSLARRLAKQQTSTDEVKPLLSIGYRISSSRVMPLDEAGLDQIHTKDSRHGIAEHNFGSIETSLGTINMHVMYRTECDFTTTDPYTPSFGSTAEDISHFQYSSRSNSFLAARTDDYLSTSGSGTASRRVSAPAARPIAGGGGTSRVTVLGTSPRSFGATGRMSMPNAAAVGGMAAGVGGGTLPVTLVNRGGTSGGGPPSVGTSSVGGGGGNNSGKSPAFTLSGSFPRNSYTTNKSSGLADAIAMGLFDGTMQRQGSGGMGALPFSVGVVGRGDTMPTLEQRKSFEDVFAGLEESPPFDVFLRRDPHKKYGASLSSNHSNNSNTSLTHNRHSITYPRAGSGNHGIPFTTTILDRRFPSAVGTGTSDPSRSSVTSTALVSRAGSGLPIIPGSTPPTSRTPFSTSLTNSHGFNPTLMTTVPAVSSFGQQTPPPFVTMTNLGEKGRRISGDGVIGVGSFGSSVGGGGSVLFPQTGGAATGAGSFLGDLNDFLKGVESRRRSLVVRPKSAASANSDGGVDTALSSKPPSKSKGSRNQSLARFKQLKESYSDFSSTLASMAAVEKPVQSRSGTPPPMVLASSSPPPAAGGSLSQQVPATLGTSPKSTQGLRSHSSLSTIDPLTNFRISASSEKPRRPSSLQHVIGLSTVLSESENSSSASGGLTAPAPTQSQQQANNHIGSPIAEEPAAVLTKHPYQPPHFKHPPAPPQARTVFTADPARVTAGFFPPDRLSSNASSSGGSQSVDDKSPQLAIEPVHLPVVAQHLLADKPTSSSLSTSLRSVSAVGSTAGVRAASAERTPQASTFQSVLPRRNSSGGGAGRLHPPSNPSPRHLGTVAVSEGGGNVAAGSGGVIGKVGKLGSRFGSSAPVEVPFVKRSGAVTAVLRAVGGGGSRAGENSWDCPESEGEDDDDSLGLY